MPVPVPMPVPMPVAMQALQGAFVASYARANPDMQSRFGYEADAPLQGNLAVCSNQIAQRFDCRHTVCRPHRPLVSTAARRPCLLGLATAAVASH